MLIAISGIDGAGKSTQAARLHEQLPGSALARTRLTAQQGMFALSQHLYGDPYDYHPGIPATLREFALACDILSWSRDTLAPLVALGAPVVWDRSTLCYETYARVYGADLTWPLQLLALVEKPDLIVLLDLDPSDAVRRLEARSDKPHQADESTELLVEARAEYLRLAAQRPEVVVVDAGQSEESVGLTIQQLVTRRFRL